MESLDKAQSTSSYNCTNCGAELKFKPGTTHLNCEYCGTMNEIPQIEVDIEELDFKQYLNEKASVENTIEIQAVKCKSCGATSSIDSKLETHYCPYCSTPLIHDEVHKERLIRPRSLLPFKLNANQAKALFKKWIKRSFWSPNKLKKAVLNFDHFKGVYLPYWTYDAASYSRYSGQRGEYYYVTQTYQTTEDGRPVTRTRQVRKTRWYNVRGQVNHQFDDVLVCSSTSVPAQYVQKLEPWDLHQLVPFDEKYLSGFITEKYQVDLEGGFVNAKQIMDQHIRQLVYRDIGGDEQRIHSLQTHFDQITFKHLLLPAFISAYKFRGKLYRFLINARTGEIQGERPISKVKVAIAVILGLMVLGILYYFAQQQQ